VVFNVGITLGNVNISKTERGNAPDLLHALVKSPARTFGEIQDPHLDTPAYAYFFRIIDHFSFGGLFFNTREKRFFR